MVTIIRLHCERRITKNKKLKHLNQRYCGRKKCQWKRKLNSERNRYRNEPSYRSKKLLKALERKKDKAIQGNPQYYSDYQRAYRASHPGYVLQNKVKQRERYRRKKDKTSVTTKIVNPDALMPQRIEMLSFTDKKPLFVRLL